MEKYKQDLIDQFKELPVENEDGSWDARDANGHGHTLGYPTASMVDIWLDGYDAGARENM